MVNRRKIGMPTPTQRSQPMGGFQNQALMIFVSTPQQLFTVGSRHFLQWEGLLRDCEIFTKGRVTVGVISAGDTGEGCEGNSRPGRHAASVTQLYMSRVSRLYVSRRGWRCRLPTMLVSHFLTSYCMILICPQFLLSFRVVDWGK